MAGVSRVELEADLAEVAVARRFVRASLQDIGADVNADAQLIASELVTNAVEHGGGSSVVVELRRRDAEVDVTVESVGPSPSVGEVEDWRVAAPDEVSGRSGHHQQPRRPCRRPSRQGPTRDHGDARVLNADPTGHI